MVLADTALLDGVDGREQASQDAAQRTLNEIGWSEAYDESGRRYYYNITTGVSSWVSPLEGGGFGAGGGSAASAPEVKDGGEAAADWVRRVQEYAQYYGMSTEDADGWLRREWASMQGGAEAVAVAEAGSRQDRGKQGEGPDQDLRGAPLHIHVCTRGERKDNGRVFCPEARLRREEY